MKDFLPVVLWHEEKEFSDLLRHRLKYLKTSSATSRTLAGPSDGGFIEVREERHEYPVNYEPSAAKR